MLNLFAGAQMNPRLYWIAFLLIALLVLPSPPSLAGLLTQEDEVRELKLPGRIHGFIGGESHDTYRIAVAKGERLIIRFAWRHDEGNRAEATVSARAAFEDAEPLASGAWSLNGEQWVGTIQETGPVYVYVVAHPSAHYTLSVRRSRAGRRE